MNTEENKKEEDLTVGGIFTICIFIAIVLFVAGLIGYSISQYESVPNTTYTIATSTDQDDSMINVPFTSSQFDPIYSNSSYVLPGTNSDNSQLINEIDEQIDLTPFRKACEKKGGTVSPSQKDIDQSEGEINILSSSTSHYSDASCLVDSSVIYYQGDLK